MTPQPQDDHWLVREGTVRWLWRAFLGVLAVTVLLQLVVKVKGYFALDDWFAFGAVFGFLSCVVMVVVAKGLGYVLKRSESYYEAEHGDD